MKRFYLDSNFQVKPFPDPNCPLNPGSFAPIDSRVDGENRCCRLLASRCAAPCPSPRRIPSVPIHFPGLNFNCIAA